MAAKKAIPLKESDFIFEVAKRVTGNGEPELTEKQVKMVVKAVKDEIASCMATGYKVSLLGLASFTPAIKAGRKKGTISRNPATGETKTLRADEPDKFVVRVGKSPALGKVFPTLRTRAGEELFKLLGGKVARKK